jgi:hypothetical protein
VGECSWVLRHLDKVTVEGRPGSELGADAAGSGESLTSRLSRRASSPTQDLPALSLAWKTGCDSVTGGSRTPANDALAGRQGAEEYPSHFARRMLLRLSLKLAADRQEAVTPSHRWHCRSRGRH